jgi:lipoprotein NlpD
MKRIVYPFLFVLCAALVACTTSETRAPVHDISVGVSQVQPQRVLSGPGYYTVVSGDTLFQISRRYSQRVSDLVTWNNLQDANQINVGQVLRVAPPDQHFAADAPTAVVQTAAVDDDSRDVRPIESAPAQPVAEDLTRQVSDVVWGWPTDGKVTRNFVAGQNIGITIVGSRGQRVVAAADGRVILSGTMDPYGNIVIIKHNDEMLSAYAHNDSNLVAQGSNVTRGQQIATMGSSGTDSVMLHFQVRRQGKPVDPLDFLPRR